MNAKRRFFHGRMTRCAIAIVTTASLVTPCNTFGGEISPLPPVHRTASRDDAWNSREWNSHAWNGDRTFEPRARRDDYGQEYGGQEHGKAFSVAHTPNELDRPLLEFDPLEQALDENKPDGSKPGIFQEIRFSETFLPQPNFDDLGLNEWQLSATFGFPLPTRQSPLLITPAYEQTLLDGPTMADLPATVYDVTVQFLWMHQLTERWGMQLGVTPGVHSDFERSDADSLRIGGRAIGLYEWNEDVKLVLGVVYLDRNDVSLLPAAGIIWTPHENIRWELVAPRPRVAWRFSCQDCVEQWAYIAGEFGGGEWSIVRTGGASDVATYRDFRLLFGLERKPLSAYGMHLNFEFGYVFARELEFASVTPDVSLDDTTIVRLTLSY
jgi:hypothetical protein